MLHVKPAFQKSEKELAVMFQHLQSVQIAQLFMLLQLYSHLSNGVTQLW